MAAIAVITSIPFVAIDIWADRKDIQGFQNALEHHVWGSDAVSDWLQMGALEPSEARDLFTKQIELFKSNLKPLRQRREDLLRLGLWTPKAGELALNIMNRIGADAPKLLVSEDLVGRITSDPDFKALSEEVGESRNFTLLLWLVPRVDYLGKSDIEWLYYLVSNKKDSELSYQQKFGLESLRLMFQIDKDKISLPTFAKMTALTMKKPKDIRAKMAKTQSLGLPFAENTFYRADLPFGDRKIKQGTHEIELKDEVDRWKIILTDPRFQKIADAWRRHEIPDFDALSAFESYWDR